MRDFLAGFTLKRISIFIFIVASFTYNVLLDREMQCTCKNKIRDCYCFLWLPACACMIVILMTDEAFHGTWCNVREFSRTCCRARCLFHCKFCFSLGKALLVGLLWLVSVFMDGDWYVCCWTDFGQHPQLPCKEKTNITYEEQLIITDEKNVSRVWGILMLIGILSAGCLLSLCEKWCHKNHLFNELVVQELETVLDEVAREKIKEELNNKIKAKVESGKWHECLKAAEDLIGEGPTSLRRDDEVFYSAEDLIGEGPTSLRRDDEVFYSAEDLIGEGPSCLRQDGTSCSTEDLIGEGPSCLRQDDGPFYS